MTHYEMVELLREKANVSYQEAKDALEAANWDLLDAIVLLEHDGKTMNRPSSYSTKAETETEEEPPKKSEFKDGMNRIGKWIQKLVNIGNSNSFVIHRNNDQIIVLPVTAFALLLAFTFYFTVPALLVGLFFGFRYSFRGAQLGKDTVNSVMDKASDIVDNVKAEFQNESNKDKNDE